MKKPNFPSQFAFTLVEAVVAISLVGLGITSAVAALTKFNAFANVSRNSTGAYAAVMSQIDAIQTASPFNPAEGEIPDVLKIGTYTSDPNKPPKVYTDPLDPNANPKGMVDARLTTTVEDVSANGVTLYRATVTVEYDYLNRTKAKNNPYRFSMSTLRASDE